MRRTLFLTIASLLAASSFAPAVASAGNQDALYGKRYTAVAVTKDGKPYEFVEGTRLWVDFRRKEEDVVWRAGCNYFGAQVGIDGNRIDVGPIVSTDMACPGVMAQDRFFARFFAADPAYEAFGRHASLFTNRVEIELRRRPG